PRSRDTRDRSRAPRKAPSRRWSSSSLSPPAPLHGRGASARLGVPLFNDFLRPPRLVVTPWGGEGLRDAAEGDRMSVRQRRTGGRAGVTAERSEGTPKGLARPRRT